MNFDLSKNPFIFLTLISVIGILLGKFFIAFEIALWISLGLLFLSLLSKIILKNANPALFFLFASIIFLMVLRWNAVYSYPNNHIAFMEETKIESITGIVVQANYRSTDKNKYILDVSSAIVDNKPIETCGKVLLTTVQMKKRYFYGDFLNVKCKLQKPKGRRNPGQFDYKNYLSGKGIYLLTYVNRIDSIEILKRNAGNILIQNIIEPVKIHVNQMIKSNLSANNGAILKALLLGEKKDIENRILDQFKNVGVVHVLAISGLHVGFIVLFIFVLLSFFRLNYNTKIIILLLILFIYVAVINFKAPVVRASIMAGLYFLAKVSERKINLFNIVFFAAFIILLIDPHELFNPGFQFSFVAVLSIVYGYPKLNTMFPLKSKLREGNNRSKVRIYFSKFIWDPFLVSIAAVLGTLPLTIYYYGIIPTYALVANIIVIPLIGLIVILGLLLVIFSLISSTITSSLGIFIDLLFDLLKYVISVFDKLPYSHFHSTTPSIITIILLLILVYLLFNFASRKHRTTALAIATIIILINLETTNNSGDLEVTFLDVGQGDASFIKFPNNESMLIDGGDATKKWDQGKNAIIPFLNYNNVSRLKYAVASHPHNDHIGGLIEILNTIKVDTLVISSYKFNTKKYLEMVKTCELNKIPIMYVKKGDKLHPDSSCRVYILHPTKEFVEEHDYSGEECNNSSIVMKIQYGENGILFTGDAEKDAEHAYSKYGDFLESEIIKMGHHGSKTSSTQQLLNYVNPLAAVISVAERNKFRHPSPITIWKMKNYNIKPFLTSRNGAVQFRVSKDEIRFIKWNKNSIKLF